MRPRGWIILALATLGSASAFTAQDTRPQQPPPPRTGALAPGGTGLLAGRVVDPASGRAVPEAIVWVLVDGVLRNESPRVATDAEGRFVFVNVPAGRYSLQAEKLGYRRGFFGQKVYMDQGYELDVADGQALTDLSLPIWKHSAIGGMVTDETGEPVVGVSVRAFRKTIYFGEIRFTPNFQGTPAVTDDRGMYRLSSLVPGEYVVGVPSTLTTFPAEVMPNLSDPNIQTAAFGAISELGFLGAPANQQVGESVVLTTLLTPVPPAPTGGYVPAVYRTTLSPAATRLSEASVLALGPGEEKSGVNVTLKAVGAIRLSGRLVVPDGPISPTAIRLIPSDVGFSAASPGFEAATGLSDADGRFTLLGVPEGQYVLWVETRPRVPAGQPNPQPFWWASEAVTVGSASVTDFTVTLRRPPRLSARMEVKAGQTVRTYLDLLIEPIGFGTSARQRLDPGRTIAVELVPGRYLITPFLPEVACTAVMSQGRDVSDEPLVLDRDDVEVTVACGETPSRLSGTVRSERGTADPDTLVVVFPADRRHWPGADVRPRRITSARPSPAGVFSFTNLPPGEYLVAALPVESSEFWQDPKRLDTLARTATRVALAQGESRTVDVRAGSNR